MTARQPAAPRAPLGVRGSATASGVLCNTSLNFKGFGFINRMSDLSRYCETRGIDDFVVGTSWFQREPRDGA